MHTSDLRDFVVRVLESKRIRFGDVRRLQRDILPDGIMTRDEAEVLIALDQSISRTDKAWADYLVSALLDFVVWGTNPTGYVDQETAEWLVTALSCARPTKTGMLIAREVLREAQEVDDSLRTFVNTPYRAVPAMVAAQALC
jgi:hypothetical protein